MLNNDNFSKNHLVNVSWDDFYGLQKVNNLELSGNNVLDIPGGTFEKMPELTTLRINSNIISQVIKVWRLS